MVTINLDLHAFIMCELARPVIVANASKWTISRIGNKLKRLLEWLIETDKDITTTVNGIYKNKKDRQLQGTWYKMHLTLSHKRDPGLCLVFQLRHWLAIWWPSDTPNSLLHPYIWRLEFLYATNGRTDKESSNMLQSSQLAPLFSLCIYNLRRLLSTVASSTWFPELWLLIFHSTAIDRYPMGKMYCYSPVEIIMVFKLF